MPDELEVETPAIDKAANKVARTASLEFWLKLGGIFGTFALVVVLLVQVISLSSRLDDVSRTAAQLASANAQQQKQSKGNALAFAVILEDLAAAFDTPPAPDPARTKAVNGLCSTAHAFRASIGAPPASDPPCSTAP